VKTGSANPSCIVLLAVVIVFALFASSCSGVHGKLLVTRANFMAARGMNSEAVRLYMEAAEHEDVAAYAQYGLGLVFFAMDENEAAAGRFAMAEQLLEAMPEKLHRELRYRNHYNAGIVLFTGGDFAGAAGAFRNALRTSSGRTEAMRNLELSLKSLERNGENTAGGGGADNAGSDEAMAQVFQYIRQKEVEKWRSREWPQEEHAPGDDR
jgi:tetratricopeptide (TPR) repeat protein